MDAGVVEQTAKSRAVAPQGEGGCGHRRGHQQSDRQVGRQRNHRPRRQQRMPDRVGLRDLEHWIVRPRDRRKPHVGANHVTGCDLVQGD